jgi:hypothetical protein
MESGAGVQAAAAPPIDNGADVDAAVAASQPTSPAAERAEAGKMFRYSTYLHVGPGAEECEHREDGECTDNTHFHAWCRLPNKFQHRDLYNKAAGAKARRLRLLHDEESDAREILESELDSFRDGSLELLIDLLLKAEWPEDYVAALKQVGEEDEYEHIEQDRERFMVLSESEVAQPEEEQTEEFKELAKHLGRWREAVSAALDALQLPKREAMRAQDRDALIDQVRHRRMTEIADEIYLHIYNQWEWFICTMQVKKHPATGRPSERYWPEMGVIDDPAPGSMWGESPEVIDALQATYNELERAQQAGVSGNS